MATTHKVTVSVNPAGRRPTSAERRAAQLETVSTHQAKLKQEAAARRQARLHDPPTAAPRKSLVTRRRNPV